MKDDYRTTYYRPMLRKTFEAAVCNFVTREFPFLRGTMIVNLFVKELKKLVDVYYPSPSHLKPGQMLWMAVDKKERPGYKKPISEMRMKPVLLSILTQEDLTEYLKGVPTENIRQSAWARCLREADAQGAVLSGMDLATIFKVCPDLVAKAVRAYEKQHRTILPRRGTIHDIGRSVSHKGAICRKKLTEGKTTSQIAQETHHAPEAVDRYLKNLFQVMFCQERGMSAKDTCFVTSMSEGLVREYAKLAEDLQHENEKSLKFATKAEET